jgi:hypothetical protein
MTPGYTYGESSQSPGNIDDIDVSQFENDKARMRAEAKAIRRRLIEAVKHVLVDAPVGGTIPRAKVLEPLKGVKNVHSILGEARLELQKRGLMFAWRRGDNPGLRRLTSGGMIDVGTRQAASLNRGAGRLEGTLECFSLQTDQTPEQISAAKSLELVATRTASISEKDFVIKLRDYADDKAAAQRQLLARLFGVSLMDAGRVLS